MIIFKKLNYYACVFQLNFVTLHRFSQSLAVQVVCEYCELITF